MPFCAVPTVYNAGAGAPDVYKKNNNTEQEVQYANI